MPIDPIGLVALGITVCQGLIQYYGSYKGRALDIKLTCDSLGGLSKSLILIQQSAETTGSESHKAVVIESLESCRRGIECLEKKLKQIEEVPRPELSAKIRSQVQRALYPFKESTLAKLREIVSDLRANLKLALIELGFSIVIEEMDLRRQRQPKFLLAYFYFKFSDKERQTAEHLLRSLLVQLSVQSQALREVLLRQFSQYDGQRQPNINVLATMFQSMLLRASLDIYIVIDALDECIEVEQLLQIIEQVVSWKIRKLHFLVTSQPKPDIQDSLHPLVTDQMDLQGAVVDDIKICVHERLKSDPKLKKLPQNIKNDIETTLCSNANGMFRWVDCQLAALRACKSPDDIYKTLHSLPETLDDTYARILQRIHGEDRKNAVKILEWLAFSARPLSLIEAAEIITFEYSEDDRPVVNFRRRYFVLEDILSICSCLVTVYNLETQRGNGYKELRLAHFSVKEYLVSDRIRIGPIRSYSLQEPLSQSRIAKACIAYLIQIEDANRSSDDSARHMYKEYPLSDYAIYYWAEHAQKGEQSRADRALDLLAAEYCQSLGAGKPRWWECYARWEDRYHHRDWEMAPYQSGRPEPLYYSAFVNLHGATTVLLENNFDVNAENHGRGTALQVASRKGYGAMVRLLLNKGADVNICAGDHGYAIVAAVMSKDEAIVQLLIESGADINVPVKYYGHLLQLAACRTSEGIVRMLLDEGADPNAQGGHFGNALQAAADKSDDAVVRLLIHRGAAVNAQGGYYGNALQAAAVKERAGSKVVQLLLDCGANVNAQGGDFDCALQGAIYAGNTSGASLLLDNGANFHLPSQRFGNALINSSYCREKELVRRLLDEGMDVNAKGGEYDNALQAACSRHDIWPNSDMGAQVHTEGGEYGSALPAASYYQNKDIVLLLLENGADINAEGGQGGSALQAASFSRNVNIVLLLLEHGADVNAEGGRLGSALQAAASVGDEEIVRLLLDKGANADARGGEYGSALEAATVEGYNTVAHIITSHLQLTRGSSSPSEHGTD
ncbi:MAG: hypothetical protein M1819_006179 [Sarea resinae]|nr:MAG: hypothetical protein M1819_006179 [Sarea resinae]